MNFVKLVALLAVLLLAGSPLIAQSALTPGALSGPPNEAPMDSAFGTAIVASSTSPRTNIANVEDTHETHVRMLWIASILAMVAATSADAATSWHRRESNGFLASSDGRFGGKGVAIKGGIAAGILAPQIIFHRHHDWYIAFSVGNFAESGIFAGAAIHNINTASPAK